MANQKGNGWWRNWPWRLIQTNLREIDMRDIDARRYVEELEAFKATVVMINTSGIIASYPTKLPFHFQSPFLTGDSLSKIIEACHAKGIKVIARTDFSKVRRALYEEHPEWAYVSPKGTIVDYNGDVHACICGDYQQKYALEIIGETITTLDVDGIFFNMGGFQTRDYSGNYYGLCRCGSCRSKFKEMFGLSLPKGEDMNDPAYRKYLVFKRRIESELKARVADHIHRLRPEICVDKAYSLGSGFIRQESNTAVDRPLPNWQYSGSDNTKWAVGSYPGFVSTNTTVDFIDIPYRHVAVSPEQQRLRLYQGLANGGAIDYYLIGRLDNHEDRTGYPAVKEVFHFHAAHEADYRGLQSRAPTLLLTEHGGNVDEYRGWFRALAENHFLFDTMLPEAALDLSWGKYRTAIVPDIEAISDRFAAKLDSFAEGGGTVIAVSRAAFRDELFEERNAPALKCLGIKRFTEVRGGMRSAYFKIDPGARSGRLDGTELVYLDGRYSYAEYESSTVRRFRLIPPHNYGPPERCYYEVVTDNPAFTVASYGKGKGIYIPWSCGALFARQGHLNSAAFMGDLLEQAAGVEPIGGTLSPMCEATLHESVEGGFTLLQIVNASGHFGVSYYPPIPIENAVVTIPFERGASKAVSLVSGESLKLDLAAGRVTVRIPRIHHFEAIRIS